MSPKFAPVTQRRPPLRSSVAGAPYDARFGRRFAHPDPADLPAMVAEAAEMLETADAERDAGRLTAAASLAINAAVRASDVICTSALGYHSCAPSHAAALDVLRSVDGSEALVEALSAVLSLKSLYNYHHGPVDEDDVDAVLDDTALLVNEAQRRVFDRTDRRGLASWPFEVGCAFLTHVQ